MSKKIALIFTCLFAMVSMAFAQSRVTGTVIASEDGEPVMGASILVKGTTVGTTTDLDGNFTLTGIPSGSKTLVISYIGMKTKEVAIKANLGTVMLESETEELEEVVVTAMGIQRQAKALGYATAKVDADQLTAAKASDATSALSGKVSGLQINVGSGDLDQQTRIQLRGARSFKGDNGALLVLDGVQTPMSFLQTLNPNDIDNISVLKGASAAALYGSEAANGVLIVTTKGGQKGKPQFTYGYTVTMNKAAYLPKLQHRFGSGHGHSTYGNIWNYDLDNSYMSTENQQFGPEFDDLPITSGWELETTGEKRIIPYTDLGPDSRWSYYQTGWAHQHDVSYSSSDDRGSMYLSYQRLDQTSTVPGDKTTRQTIRFNASRNFKALTVSAKMNYTHSNIDVSTASGSAMYTLLQVPSNYWVADFKNWREQTGSGANPNEYFSDYSANPYFLLDTQRRETRQDRVSGSIDATFQATKWLKFVARAGMNMGINNTAQRREAFHFSEWAAAIKYNASSDQVSTFNAASQYDNRFNMDIMAMSEHKIGENMTIKGMLGYAIQDNYSEYKYTNASQLAIDNFFNFSNKLGDLTASNRWSRTRKTGVFGSVDLSYKNFAFMQVTGRNDWTSLLDPSKRSFFYPSVNASFVFTDALPSLKSDAMNHWKMRASWAKVGTVNLEPYKLATLAQVNGSFPYGNTTAYRLDTTIFNRGLEPEFTSEFEVGTEFGFFNNRITLEAAGYIQRTTNQTVSVSIPTSTGYTDRYVNAGTMEGKGIELDLNIRPLIKAGDFRFNLGFNATFIKTTVVELAEGADELAIDGNINGSYVGVYAIKGMSFPMLKAQDWARDDQGRVIVDANTGLPRAGKQEIAGNTEPTVRLGITPSLKWKTFTLSATFDYRGGHKYYVGMEATNNFTGASYLTSVAGRQRIVFPNSCYWDDATQSYVDNVDRTISMSDDGYFNGTWKQGYLNRVMSAANWRLRELSLNYEMPNKLVKKLGFVQRVSASLVGRNLFMWTPKTNIFGDPEFSTNTGNTNITATSYNRNANGISSYGSAGSRSFGFNLSVTF